MTQLTPHFSLDELSFSEAGSRNGIDNKIPDIYIPNAKRVADALEIIRAHYNMPIHVLSCYRSTTVNNLVGGSKTSAHMTASAADFKVNGHGIREVCLEIPKLITDFDQIIYEFGESGWIHLGFAKNARKEMLTASKVNHITHYSINI